MKSGQAAIFWLTYHKTNSKINTIGAYEELGQKFCKGKPTLEKSVMSKH